VSWYPYYDETSGGDRAWAFHGVLDGLVEDVLHADDILAQWRGGTPEHEVRVALTSHTSHCVILRNNRLSRSECIKVWDLDEQKRVYGNHGNEFTS